jgi:hypothetical protein
MHYNKIMNSQDEEKLVKDFPQIFRDWGGDPMLTCMAWGLEIQDGWISLIRKLCEDIMALNPPEEFKAEQVKSKFGGLRFYFSCATEEINKLISIAEHESYKICEICGSKDNVTSSGSWVETLCKNCRK